MRIMLVDDSSIDLFLAEKMIKISGLSNDIVACSSASDALDHLKQSELLPDLILLDIHMPEMDGFEFLNDFMRFPAVVREKINIIMLTSSVDVKDLARAEANPSVIKLIKKPLNTHELIKVVADF
ncbi:response regulator [Solitalea longa]|uniref:Response regulator n=1 Tax=Solitalea longa TaxID=2079460 RepID=A0A2S4ZZ53_9SPHI|nr:response regulator [Solitalea longa]POY35222.1 response regulator [Solitalea longa]